MSDKQGAQFGSFFGFLMAAIGSAVGFGNIWGFPYKMGTNGGAVFLFIYLLLCIFVGVIVMIGELTLGRRDGRAAIGTYRAIAKRNNKPWMVFPGWLSLFAALFLGGMYMTLGGYALKYCVSNFIAIFSKNIPSDSETYFYSFIGNQGIAVLWTALFIGLTAFIVFKGVTGGIEKFCNVGMPLLFALLILVIIKGATLPGSVDGWEFIFSPDMSALSPGKIISTTASAGGQMFFSLSLGFGGMIIYGAYLDKKTAMVSSGIYVVVFDTLAALMAACAVFPAVFAYGLEPSSGPGLLFITMQKVFTEMGGVGFFFGFAFYLLTTIAGLSSSIAISEAAATAVQDASMGKDEAKEPMSRTKAIVIVMIIYAVMNLIVAADGLGTTGLPQPLGFCWLDFFDLFAEGLLMPFSALVMTIFIGYIIKREGMAAEIETEGNKFSIASFYMFCAKTLAPIGMAFILLGQIDSFFGLGWFS